MINLPRILTSDLAEVARVRPVKLSYKLNKTPLSTATLIIRTVDATVTPGMFVELFDTRGSIGIFRVAKTSRSMSGDPQTTLSLEHAIVTLSDSIVFGYKEYGGTGKPMTSVFTSLLALQTTAKWQIGTVDFSSAFQYSFENDNLLTAIMSLATPLTSEYLWDFDFTTTPWTLNLLSASVSDASEIRLNRNLDGLKIEIDNSNQCTRIYPLGYGEGVNQLTIASVNGGHKYLDDLTAQAIWGIIASVYTETSITDAATLMAAAQAQLDARKDPIVTITASAHELYELTGESFDAFYLGRLCRVPLPDYGITMDERVLSIAKNDVFGAPTKATVVLANTSNDTSSTLASLSRKSAISQLYSQGATNQYALHFADNADNTHPAELSFYVDPAAVQINSVACRYKLEAFRGYSKGAESGGGSSTTSSGGGDSTQTSSSGGGSTTSSGGGNVADSGHNYSGNAVYSGVASGDFTRSASGHSHELNNHDHSVAAAISNHTHSVSVSPHTHSVSVPSHTHTVDIPAHTHSNSLGIYTGTTASSVVIKVDGNTVPAGAITNREFDAVPYLSKDANGRITRGAWHSVTFTPNTNTRIVADIHVKTFVRSISGGNY